MPEKSIQRVAVIGAGISGVVSAGHLLAAGLNVTVFERSRAAGGVWLYDKRLPIENQYPCTTPSEADNYGPDDRERREKQYLIHAPPGPCYESLTNNVSTPLLRTKLNAWPNGTPPYVLHHVLKDYIQDTSKKAGVEAVTIYGALVTKVSKQEPDWEVAWSLLHNDPTTGEVVKQQRSARFDAIVVASGHYHTPLIPDIPGLAEAKAQWPSRITHSKSFRNARGFEGKNVLLIGGGVSSVDIARELNPVAQNIYQSTRRGPFDIPASALPAKATRTEQVVSFQKAAEQDSGLHLPLTAHLQSGETLTGIDHIVLCTGYQMVLPFLPQYTRTDTFNCEIDETTIVTDGTQFHHLYRDMFYIPDPTLAFVGVSFHVSTFTLFEFQAIAVAAFFSGAAQLPSTESMRSEYQEQLALKGPGRSFHSLKGHEEAYVHQIIEWVNAGRAAQGLPAIEGHTASWLEEKKVHAERLALIFQGLIPYGNTPEPVPVEIAAAA
ncbi:hypothetical protein N7462_005217 [Penicillium macrosclerotiorum]|uniref:uncharacterized protein n=1 Tax=Penicillium macrosclerotiorum TaxID=303699 RepID=UPI0025477809|nr:uncharacterized protein N7462_005217 [Penicillium macrosclerotiorum]KAJ5690825.1 hypothetical protein N7462_005217 [Penicillium macrosclerotiorum]